MPNLNSLSETEIVNLGLTPAQARRIISRRSNEGFITSIEDPFLETLSLSARTRLSDLITDSDLEIFIPNTEVDDETDWERLLIEIIPQPKVLNPEPYSLEIKRRLDSDRRSVETYSRPIVFNQDTIHYLHDVSPDHQISVYIKNAEDKVIFERTFGPASEGFFGMGSRPDEYFDYETDIRARFTLNILDLLDGSSSTNLANPRLERDGHFIVLTKPDQRFDHYRLTIAPITSTLSSVTASLLEQSENLQTGGMLLDQSNAKLATLLSAFPLTSSSFDFDGSFSINLPLDSKQTSYLGWVWLLTGPKLFFGFQQDQELFLPKRDVTIILPAFGLEEKAQGIPYDVSEQALLNRPDLFADDPGTTCKPFNNPGRVLGERRFHTILRVTQPEVEGTENKATIFIDEASRPIHFPRENIDKSNQVKWEDENRTKYQAKSISIGHILEFAVRWRSNGYSLGNIAYSLTLAPRQTRRIVKVDFSRRERAVRSEDTLLDDSVRQDTLRERDYSDAVSSGLDEWSQGSSFSKTTGVAGGAGFALGGFVIGGGASHGRSFSEASQQGGRRIAASERQQLTDAIRQHGQSLRSLESTVVTEAEQEERVEGVSEVVRNINYCHSLSVIYYEILRHLRVDTEVAGVRECVFVPLEIKNFDDKRIRNHQEVLRRYARGYEQRMVYDYLDYLPAPAQETADAANLRWEGSDIPAGSRFKQQLTSLRGSIYIQMGITRPQEGEIAEDIDKAAQREFTETKRYKELLKKYSVYAFYMNRSPSEVVLELYATPESNRDRIFQQKVAPFIARNYLDELILKVGDNAVESEADFTLATSYRYASTMRVDFTLEVKGITREQVEKIVVHAPGGEKKSLPANSFVNVTGGYIEFSTDHYQRRITANGGTRDLIKNVPNPSKDGPETQPDGDGAELLFNLSGYERKDLRKDLEETYDKLLTHLNENLYRYHKAIWWSMDRDELYTLLDGFSFKEAKGRSLASLIERRPIGILGNCLIFRTTSEKPLDEMFQSFERLSASYQEGLPKSDPIRVSLPTNGLYARAHMDDCNACEEHAGSRDWVLNQEDPALADLPASLFGSRRSEPQGLTPTPLPSTIINLQNAPEAPAPSGLKGSLDAVTKGDSFRDLAGLAGTQQAAVAAMQTAAQLADSFGDKGLAARLAENAKDAAAAKNIKAMTDAVDQAQKKGLITKENAQKILNNFADKQASKDGSNAAEKVVNQAKELAQTLKPGASATIAHASGKEGSSITLTQHREQGVHPWEDDPQQWVADQIEAARQKSENMQQRIRSWRQAIPALARREFDFWELDDGTRRRERAARQAAPNQLVRPTVEQANQYFNRLVEYRRATGESNEIAFNKVWDEIDGSEDEAWSASFNSYIMQQAGVRRVANRTRYPDGFRFNASHSRYIAEALINRLNRDYSRPFWLYRLDEVAVEVGDIICKSSGNPPADERIIFDDLLGIERVSRDQYVSFLQFRNRMWSWNGDWLNSHSDIIMEVGDVTVGSTTLRCATTVGGNTTHTVQSPVREDTVAQKRYRLTQDNQVAHEVDRDLTDLDSSSPYAVIKMIDHEWTNWQSLEEEVAFGRMRSRLNTFEEVFPGYMDRIRNIAGRLPNHVTSERIIESLFPDSNNDEASDIDKSIIYKPVFVPELSADESLDLRRRLGLGAGLLI